MRRSASRHIDAGAAHAAFGDTVEVARFDFGDPATYAAFEGVRAMFLLRPPQISNVRRTIRPALLRHNTPACATSSSCPSRAPSNPIVPHGRIEDDLRASDMAWTFVRAAYFMQNLSTTHALDIRRRDEIYLPAGRDSRTAHVDARDVAAVAAVALTEPGHTGRAYVPTGPAALTYDECAAILSDVLGRPIHYADPTPWH